jgi:hypothetical protein
MCLSRYHNFVIQEFHPAQKFQAFPLFLAQVNNALRGIRRWENPCVLVVDSANDRQGSIFKAMMTQRVAEFP